MKKITFLRDCRGATSMMTVILMAAFIGVLALVIDLGHLHTVQNELRNAADACALRGARAYFPDNLTGLEATDPDPANAKTQASLTILVNKSDNTGLQDLPVGDIEVGIWNYTERKLYPWAWPPDPSDWGKYIGPGIRLPTKRTAAYNFGPVSMTLANIFGISTVPVGARATAALSGVGGFYPGAPTFPYAINKDLLPTSGGQTSWVLSSNPDTQDEGGWTNLITGTAGDTPPNTNISDIKKILSGIPISNEVNQDDYLSLNNGVACSAIKAMINDQSRIWYLVQENTLQGHETAPKEYYVPDPNHFYLTSQQYGVLTVMFPLVKVDKFNQYAMYGAITADIVKVVDSPGCTFTIQNLRDDVAPNTIGGGPYYGTLSLEPKLVQ